jgi:hypothetical protein
MGCEPAVELTGWMIDLIYTDGREADGRRYFVSEYFSCGVTLVGIDEHARYDTMAVEGLSVGGMCMRLSRI